MSESPENADQQPGENPTSEELDVEGPNESTQSHGTQEDDPDAAQEGAPPGSNS